MFKEFAKRSLCVILALVMLLSIVPMSTFAADTHEHTQDETISSGVESELLKQVKAEINAILDDRSITNDMDESGVQEQLYKMDGETAYKVWGDILALEETASTMSEEEFAALESFENFEIFCVLYNTLDQMMNPPIMMLTTVEPIAGKVSVSDTANTAKLSSGTVTSTIKGSLFSGKSNTVTVVNETADTATLSFDYTATATSAFKINGQTAGTSGNYSAILAPNGSVTITITSNSTLSGNGTATLKLSNFSLVVAKTSSNVTFEFDSTKGSITVDGTAVNSGDVKEVSLTDGATLVATAKSGVTFHGWVDTSDGQILSTAATYKITPADDVTVKPVFIGADSVPYFMLGSATQKSQSSGFLGLSKLYYYTVSGSYIFDNLNDATAAAASSTSKAIVLMNSGTLPAGDYTIPSGVTLLIPFDSANTMYTTQAVGLAENVTNGVSDYVQPYVYKKLTMAEGANLTINGSVSLSAKHYYAQGSKTHGCAPSGPCGFIEMNSNSSITVNNGGALYTYGFIYGDGSITAKSGSVVYENFQIADFRGGTQSTDMDNGVFPLSQYYVQNIEVPLTIESGATEYGYSTIYMSNADFGSAVGFIASKDAMFNLTSGSVTKRYDGKTDRLNIDLEGSMSVASINMTVGTSSINSKNYELPVTSNLTLNVKEGSSISINQDVALLPGSKIHINEGATCTLGSGYNFYLYDADDWGGYASPANKKFIPVGYAPGKEYTRTEADLVDAEVRVDGFADASQGYIYTTAGGGNIYSTGAGQAIIKPGTQTKTYQLIQAKDTAQSKYAEIPLTSAKLKNADGSYVETTKTPGTYDYVSGVWNKTCHHIYSEEITKNAECELDGLKTFTCPCGDIYTEIIPKTGHKEVVDEAVAPDCVNTGLTQGSHCENCGHKFVEQEVVPAKGHTAGVDADCVNAQTCTVCNAELKAALGHDYDSVVTAPSCTVDGYTTHTCSRCNDTYTDSIVPSVGHKPVIDEGYDATCTDTGLTDGQHCSECDEVLVAQEEIPALGHTPGEDADCTTAQICTVCNAELVPSLGHDHKPTVFAPTCTQWGYTRYECSRCDDYYDGDYVENTGHTAGSAATCTTAQICTVCNAELNPSLGHDYESVVTPPSCEDKGYTTHTCTRCDDTYTDSFVDETGHTEVVDEAVAPSCTDTGLTEGKHCSVCEKVLVKQEEVPSKGHSLGEDADCMNAQKCTVCGTELEAALGHDHKAVVTAPTCKTEGFTTYTCSRCGDSYVGDTVAALGHTEVIDEAVPSTCTSTGLTEGKHCSVCNEVLVAQEEVPVANHTPGDDATCTAPQVCTVCNAELAPKLGHDYKGVVTAPTCEENGFTTYTCTRCNHSYVGDVVVAKGHTVAIDKAVAPDCENTGLTEGQHCSVCDTVLVEQKEVPKLGHTEAVDDAVAPDCENTGLTEGKHCSVCDKVLVPQEEVAALGHKEVIMPALDATCTSTGLTEGKYCSVCTEVLVPQEETPIADHDLEYHEGKSPTYTDNGWKAYESCKNCDYSTFEAIAALGEPEIKTYDEFMANLPLLEELAYEYARQNPGKDPLALVIKYIRTGVDRYNSGSWGIMAGYEDEGFAKFVKRTENEINAELPVDERLAITSLKNIYNFDLINGDNTDFGHMFGAMDITYHNKGSENHADVSGWAGDLVDLLSTVDRHNVSGTLDEMVADISENYLCNAIAGESDQFGPTDMIADLDAYYIMETLYESEYNVGDLTAIFNDYFTEDLNDVERADYFLKNRLDGVSTRSQVRNAVYNAYTSNKMIATLEGTREFNNDDLTDLRKASCYAFADYICRLAGDFVDVVDNPYFTNFSTKTSILAPGITQEINQATSADNKQMVYYLATADLTRDDVHIYANYNNNDPTKWEMQRVLDQANAAQNKYGNPESEHYIENYNVIASVNGDGFNMETGEPGGLLVMNGVEYHPVDGGGFFAILKDGTPMIGTKADWAKYKDQVQEAIGGFGTTLVKDGEICVTRTDTYYTSRAPRTAVGITKTGKVVFMVLDGRQEPVSCGGSMEEIAQIMLEAGCVHAINLDGGGSTTFVTKQEGEDELAVVNKPSDGTARSVSTSLMMVSTAPSSTAFDHARIDSDYNYATIGTDVQLSAVGISATGNIAQLPEGLTWAVSDDRWAKISEDGVFTGLRNGSVDVYLMNGDVVVGTKTMNIVIPESVYFTRATMDAVYGSTVTLPVAALYEGKQVAITENDVTLSLDNAKAGVIDGFTFTGAENTGIKVAKVTATLNADTSITGSITVNLFKQGENSFDFDKAIGGDRMLAFDRQVSNSKTDDNMTYVAVDTNEDMVTSYTFAMDLTQIPIPEQLQDLTYMLPGADMEGVSAWDFLLQLAERVSVLTQVNPVMQFDKNFDVDYSELSIYTEYFTLTGTDFDEETNSLTLKLNWIDQTQAIDPATANPLCLVNGIKLTPKDDANWDAKNSLRIVNSGKINYDIYLRANALYSFASKPENQEIYGLKPFINPNIPSESGARFGATYKEFEDTYTLENALKNGWYNEDGGFAYYVEGEKLTGIKAADGYYYDFGENGINIGQTKYTGLFKGQDGNNYYAKAGELQGGWNMIGSDWYYFATSTKAAVSGAQKIGGIYFEFDDQGKIIKGAWIHTLDGIRYYYGPSYFIKRWECIDNEWYYFRNGFVVTGISEVASKETIARREWHDFGEDGKDGGFVPDGLLEHEDGLYYIINGEHTPGLAKIDGDYYFFNYSGGIVKDQKYYAYKTNCDLPCSNYEFGADGKMLQGIVEKDGQLLYYVNGKFGECGLTKVGDDYYDVYWNGVVRTGKQYTPRTNCDLPVGNYEYGADGKMLQGVVEKEDGLYYYVNGKLGECGLTKIGDDYYDVYWGGVVRTGKQYTPRTNCDLPVGNYEYGADGKMLQGVVEKEDGLYYYVNGKLGECGLTKIGDDYYDVYWGGVVRTGKQYTPRTNCDLPVGNYEYGADGKMLQGVVEKEDGLYYYVNGKLGECGLTKDKDGNYYDVYWGGVVKTGKQYVSRTNCDLPVGNYEFGEDGKMLNGLVVREDATYYYENGKLGDCGLRNIDGDYYYVGWHGYVETGKQYVSRTQCDLPVGNYTFDADGKLVNGFLEEDGKLYYYENGKTLDCGLRNIDGDYYYIGWHGYVETGKQYVTRTQCDLPVGNYEFGADGKILDGFVEKSDGRYYYTLGKGEFLGLVRIDGDYYYVNYNGKLITNQKYYVAKSNKLMIEKTYTFNELGQIIG